MDPLLLAQLEQVVCSEHYHSACTRKNCAIAALWFAARFCTEKDPKTAIIVPSGGILIYNLEEFSIYYYHLTNTEKKEVSKSNFSYAARQNLDNHFVNMPLGPDAGFMYFYNPYFLPQYNSPSTFITRDIINGAIRPWTRELKREAKDEFQQMWMANMFVLKRLKTEGR